MKIVNIAYKWKMFSLYLDKVSMVVLCFLWFH